MNSMRIYFLASLFTFSFIFPFLSLAENLSDSSSTDPLSVEAKLQPYELHAGQGAQLNLKFKLPNKFHAYADKFKVVILEPDGVKYGEFSLSPIHDFYDKFSKKNRPSVDGVSTLILPFEAPSHLLDNKTQLKVELTYQACSDTYCLFPVTKTLLVPFAWVSSVEATKQTPEKSPNSLISNTFSDESVKNALENNLLLAFILVFLSGLLTSFTPCIFPMIPITLAILGHDSEKRSRLQNFSLSVFYVIGIASTYSILGVIAASSGQLFGSSLGHPLVIATMCLIFFLMALSMYGVFELQMPAFLRNNFHKKKQDVNFIGAYLSGIAAGVVASPCVGPVLITLLAFVASTQSRVLGLFLLFTYAIGLGVIFLVLGAFTQLARKLPRSGPWMDGMKFLLGSLMLGAFYYYLGFLIPQRWHDGLVGLGMIILASFYGAFMTVGHGGRLRRVQKGLMQSLLALGIGFILVAGLQLRPLLLNQFNGPFEAQKNQIDKSWQPYSEELVLNAKAKGQPVIIDFFADWCLACHELDEKTFSQIEIQNSIKDFTKLRFDATKDTPAFKALRQKYKIMGLPTVIFLNSKGEWVESATLNQFEEPKQFLERLEKLKSL